MGHIFFLLLVTVGTAFWPRPCAWMNRVKVAYSAFLVFLAASAVHSRVRHWTFAWLALLAVFLLGCYRGADTNGWLNAIAPVSLGKYDCSGQRRMALTLLLGAAGALPTPGNQTGGLTQPLALQRRRETTLEASPHGYAGRTDEQLAAANKQGEWVLGLLRRLSCVVLQR